MTELENIEQNIKQELEIISKIDIKLLNMENLLKVSRRLHDLSELLMLYYHMSKWLDRRSRND